MFKKLNQLAEQSAQHASRREFLGRFGRGAMTLAAVMSGVLAMPQVAQAANRARCCYYRCGGRGGTSGYYVCRANGSACPHGSTLPRSNCVLRSQSMIAKCSNCRSY